MVSDSGSSRGCTTARKPRRIKYYESSSATENTANNSQSEGEGASSSSDVAQVKGDKDSDLKTKDEKEEKKKKKNLVAGIVRLLPCVTFALGAVWILLFPLVTITTGEAKPRGTFVDENAMLIHHTTVELQSKHVDWARPGLLRVTHPPQATEQSGWADDHEILQYSKCTLLMMPVAPTTHDVEDGAGGAAWVCNLLRGMNLPCYTHTFYEVPASKSGLRASIYTVLEPAPGADGKECMVLTTAQDLSGSAEALLEGPAFLGLSVSLSILKQLKDHVGWMSKRVVLLVVDESSESVKAERLHVGVKAFVDDYHLNTLDLLERHQQDRALTHSVRHSGVIRAAISLDLRGTCLPETTQLLSTGLNGELPNMDLLNTAVIHLDRQGVKVVLDRCSTPLHDESHPSSCTDAVARAESAVSRLVSRKYGRAFQGYLDRLFAMLGFMGSMVIGPSGPHAHFLKHSVDALTIRGIETSGGGGDFEGEACTRSHARRMGAIIAIVRGISNLEEELHHSFFAYVMLSTRAFVSMGEYAYALALLLFPLVMQARGFPRLYRRNRLLSAVLTVVAFEAFGALLLLGASIAPEPSTDALYRYLQLATLVGYLLVIAVRLVICSRQKTTRVAETEVVLWEGPRMVVACLVAYSCSVTALLSWPVAAVLALTHVPVLAMASPFRAKCLAGWGILPLMLVSLPVCWPWLLGFASGGGFDGGIAMMLHWLRWYRLSGLLNLPLMCVVSFPAHLTAAYILISPHTR